MIIKTNCEPVYRNSCCRSLLGLNSRSWPGKTASETELVSTIRVELLPGGITRGSEDLEFKWIDALTNFMLEVAKLLLTAASIRKRELVARKDGEGSKHDVVKRFSGNRKAPEVR